MGRSPCACTDNTTPQAELYAAINEANIQPWSKTSIHLYCEHSQIPRCHEFTIRTPWARCG